MHIPLRNIYSSGPPHCLLVALEMSCITHSSLKRIGLRRHFGLLNDAFSLLVLLAFLERFHVFPAKDGLAAIAVHIRDGVQPCDQDSVFFRPEADVDNVAEKVRPPMSALERLGDDLIVLCEMRPAIAAAVDPRTTEVDLEHFAHLEMTWFETA